jgi:uncharacterized protein DUF5667
VVGREGRKRLDQLIDQVARGERQLSSISDPKEREAVRVALRLHKNAPAAPDAYSRARMRARVMAGLEPRRPNLRDNAWTALELLARPAPYIVRAIALASVMACLGLGTIVASADTLPDDLLYPLKLTTEQVRLALADAPGDRASVELSIAAHRLSEAERLAGSGRTSDALVASALYSQHIASAAAELAAQDEETDLGAQLETAFKAQRDRAQALAVTLSADVKSARGAQILAMIASPTYAPGQTKIEQVASTAASVAQQLSVAADQAAADEAAVPSAPAADAPATPQSAATAAPTPSVPATSTPSATVTPTASPSASATASATAASAPTNTTQSATDTTPSTSTTSAATTGTTSTTANTTTNRTDTNKNTTNETTTNQNTPTSDRAKSADRGTTANGATTSNGSTTSTNSNTRPADTRAQDAARTVKDAAEKAKAAADKLKEVLKERDSKRGR